MMLTCDPFESITKSVSGHLEPRDVMDFLYQEHALSEDDMELVNAQVKRKDRCRLLVERLAEKQDMARAFRTLVRSLEGPYDFLTKEASKCVEQFIKSCSKKLKWSAADVTGSSFINLTPIPPQRCQSLLKRGREVRKRQTDMCRVMPVSLDKRRTIISRMYDVLSTELNSGEFATFEAHAQQYQLHDNSADVKCTVLYLQACQAMFCNDIDEADRKCREARALVPKTENPVMYDVEMMSLVAWRYVELGKLNKLQVLLTGAMQKIASNQGSCIGKVAGWIYVDYVHLLSTMLEFANPKRGKALRRKAIDKTQVAIQHFDEERGKDGSFGKCFALIKFAVLLLRCGNRMQFANLRIAGVDVRDAEHLLRKVENSDIGIPSILKVFYSIAMADLNFRKRNLERAINHAEEAVRVAAMLKMEKEHELANIRLSFLRNISVDLGASYTDLSTLPLDSSWSRSSGCRDKYRYITCKALRHQARWLSRRATLSSHFLTAIEYVRFVALVVCVGVGFLIPVV